jgi:hypothetical protein
MQGNYWGEILRRELNYGQQIVSEIKVHLLEKYFLNRPVKQYSRIMKEGS